MTYFSTESELRVKWHVLVQRDDVFTAVHSCQLQSHLLPLDINYVSELDKVYPMEDL